MARAYRQQYQDTRERVMRHREAGTYEVWNGRSKSYPGFKDPEDAERVLHMADVYDPDKFTVDPPTGQKAKSGTTLKGYLTGLKKSLRTSRSRIPPPTNSTRSCRRSEAVTWRT